MLCTSIRYDGGMSENPRGRWAEFAQRLASRKRSADFNARAFETVLKATRQKPTQEPAQTPEAVACGQSGAVGGKARTASLNAEGQV